MLLLPICAAIYCLLDVFILSRNLKIRVADGKNKKGKETLKNLQQGIPIRSGSSMIFCLLVFFKVNDLFTVNNTNKNDFEYALKWFCLPVASLVFAVINVANRRFLSVKSITGKRTEELNVHHRYLANTTEQVIIFCLIHLIVAISWSESNLAYIACNCCIFTAGRILFYRYTIWPDIPKKRALGFSLTFTPSFICVVWCIYKLITSL